MFRIPLPSIARPLAEEDWRDLLTAAPDRSERARRSRNYASGRRHSHPRGIVRLAATVAVALGVACSALFAFVDTGAAMSPTWRTVGGRGGVVQNEWILHSSKRELISYRLPPAWQLQNGDILERIGYLSAPYPVYALIAGAELATLDGVPNPPSVYVFSETPSPWFTVLVEAGTAPAPSPEKAYELAPEGELTLQEEQGLSPSVKSLTKPVDVSSGGIRGSEDRTEVIVPGAGNIELDGVVYTKGHTVWMAMVGCTVACYNANAVTLSRVISSVKVGTAAL